LSKIETYFLPVLNLNFPLSHFLAKLSQQVFCHLSTFALRESLRFY